MSTKIEEAKKKILDWMKHGIPKGKTIPVFEDLLQAYATTRDEEVLGEIERMIEGVRQKHPRWDGLIGFEEALTDIATFITNRTTEDNSK